MVPDIPWLPPSPQQPKDYFPWREAVLQHRIQIAYETSQPGEEGQLARAREIVRCERSFLYMANTYGGIFEARVEDSEDEDWDGIDPEDAVGSGILTPYVTYPFQIEYAHWLDERMRSRGNAGDGIGIKCRDMGISNETAFWVAHRWLTRKVFQARVLSRVQEEVDNTGDPDSFFWKIEMFLRGLPDWLFQAFAPGFRWTGTSKNRLELKFINPRNGNLISGAGTQTDAFRGGRATVVILDELCFMEGLAGIWTSTRAVSHHRLGVSTVSVKNGMDCYNLVHGRGGQVAPPILAITWDQHPEHTLEWYEQEQARDSVEGFRTEVLMDWKAGGGEWIYPETHPYEVGHYPYVPYGGQLYCTIDDGSDGDWVMIWLQVINATGRIRVLDAYVNSHKPVDFYGSILRNRPLSNFSYGPREREIMAWLRDLPPATYVGDTHGEHVEQIANMSAFERLWKEWDIIVTVDYQNRGYRARQVAMGALWPLIDFNDTTGGRYVLEAAQKVRLRTVKEGREGVTEQKEPIKDQWFHPISAMEFWATNFEVFRLTSGVGGASIKYTGARSR